MVPPLINGVTMRHDGKTEGRSEGLRSENSILAQEKGNVEEDPEGSGLSK